MLCGSRSIFATVRWALLALLAATLCLWVLSYWRGYTYEFRDWQRARLEDRRWGLQSGRGSITYWRHWYSWAELNPEAPLLQEPDVHESGWIRDPVPRSFFDGSNARPTWIGRFGFDMTRSRSKTYEFDRVVLPYWFIAVCLGIWPLVGIARRLRHHTRPGTCAKCGYDLRATPNRCPECGTVPTDCGSSRPPI